MREVAKIRVAFQVNGRAVTLETWPMARLLDVLREDLGLTGTKEGCGEGECGACAVRLDGILVNSCLVPMVQVAGRAVETIEGLAARPETRSLQRAFVEHNGAQCGICTPGMVVAAETLLEANAAPSEDEIREGLAGNLCRCTGYARIVTAVQEAAAERGGAAHDGGARETPPTEPGASDLAGGAA